MKWAILLYAYLVYPDSSQMEKVISWNLPFQSYEECKSFYNRHTDDLHGGVIEHGEKTYGATMTINEMGCARAVIMHPGAKPEISGLQPIMKGGNSI